MKFEPTHYLTNNEEAEISSYTVQKFIKYGLISVDDKAIDLIKNLKKYFMNYKTFDIVYENEGIKNVPNEKFDPYEILFGVIKNIDHTAKLTYDEKIIDYVSNIDVLDEIDADDYFNIISDHPIIKILYKLSKKEDNKFTLWNIINTVYDTWYAFQRDNKTKRIKYSFKNSIVITVEDILNYLGDSHYKNCIYTRGVREVDVSSSTNLTYILTPGGKFEIYEKYVENNKFVTKIVVPREITKTTTQYINAMLISGNDLHTVYGISDNYARRAALVYNVDLYNIDPYFGVPNVLTTINKKMKHALHKEDILKYLEKGGQAYTMLEMSDAEVEERKKMKIINERYLYMRDKQFNGYKEALLKYYTSSYKKVALEKLLSETYT
jgi:hypothetical protein